MTRIWLPDQDIEDDLARQRRVQDSFVFAARALRRDVWRSTVKFNEHLEAGIRRRQLARFATHQRGVLSMGPGFFASSGPPPPTDPYYANVTLLVDLDTTITDYSSTPTTTALGAAASLSATRTPFLTGTKSMNLTGVAPGNWLSTTRVPGVGTGAFTIESMIRPSAAQTGRVVNAQGLTGNPAVFNFRVDAAGSVTSVLRDSAGSGTSASTSATGLVSMSDSAWYYFTWVRDGSGNSTMRLNGTSVATSSSSTNPVGASNYYLGAYYDQTGGLLQEPFKGYIASVRITEGVARLVSMPTDYFPHS